MASTALTQPQRFVAFALNSVAFYLLYRWATGHWKVTGSGESLWLLSAVGWWTLGLLSAPWYRPPRDALGAAVAAVLALFTLDLQTAIPPTGNLHIFRGLAVAYAVFVAAAALVAAVLQERQISRVSRFSYALAERLSSGPFLFGTAAFISIFGFYRDSDIVLVLSLTWLFFALVKPIELTIMLIGDWQRAADASGQNEIGRILRIDDPNILRASVSSRSAWMNGPHVAALAGGSQRYVLPLFTHIQNEQVIGTGFISDRSPAYSYPNIIGSIFQAADPELANELISTLCGGAAGASLVGFVVEGSEIGRIRFEVSVHTGIEEGAVVFCCVEGATVFYQVMNANTAEESFHQNPRGTHIVSATQLGTWDDDSGFVKFGWLPGMNLPVFAKPPAAARETKLNAGEFVLGEVPSTDMIVKGHLPDLVSYHTAILGVTGTGKTELALDLVREALRQGTKIFCVDLTGEYRARLADVGPQTIGLTAKEAAELEDKLFAVDTGTYGAPAEKKVLKEFLDRTRQSARKQVTDFLGGAGAGLGILELAEVTNNRATLRVTELFLSEIMLWAKQHRKVRRILIVLEEAHTIIPETVGSGFDYDTQWVVGRIGQIALQGRKYGVGLLIVTQRTALVSKTILSQCNTFLTHALVDQTSLNFLGNVFQGAHVEAIPNLRFLQFLAFGKGVMSDRPLMLQRTFVQLKQDASRALDHPHDIDQPVEPPEEGPAANIPAE